MARSGDGIEYQFFDSHFGEYLLARSGQGICSIDFLTGSRAEALSSLEYRFPEHSIVRRCEDLSSLAESIFDPATDPRPPIDFAGTDFQKSVWHVLLGIPVGETVSYRWVAERIGRPAAVRAVASAIGANRMAYLVPCHRVVRTDGALGGYRWGVHRKSAMLDWERSQAACSPATH